MFAVQYHPGNQGWGTICNGKQKVEGGLNLYSLQVFSQTNNMTLGMSVSVCLSVVRSVSNNFGPDWYILTTIGWMDCCFSSDSHDPYRVNPTDFSSGTRENYNSGFSWNETAKNIVMKLIFEMNFSLPASDAKVREKCGNVRWVGMRTFCAFPFERWKSE